MFTYTGTLLLTICLAATPTETSPYSVKVIVQDKNGDRIPHAQVRVDDGKPIDTGGEAEIEVPFKGKRITIRVDPNAPDSENRKWRSETLEIPKKEVVLTVEESRLKHAAPPTVGCAQQPVCVCKMIPYCNSPCYLDPCQEVCHCWSAEPQYVCSNSSSDAGEASLIVSVPPDATVFINGKAGKITGSRRLYVSKGLMYGQNYGYVVRAQIAHEGKIIERAQEVVLKAGDSKEIALDFSSRGNQPASGVRSLSQR